MTYERIRRMRVENGLLQKDVAAYLQIAQNTYSQYEVGTIRLTAETLNGLARLFDTSVDYLMGLTDEKRLTRKISATDKRKNPAPQRDRIFQTEDKIYSFLERPNRITKQQRKHKLDKKST
ncbi:MAG: helix-turn-helix transcriptional regulator [Oscillospiraceae bacterium]